MYRNIISRTQGWARDLCLHVLCTLKTTLQTFPMLRHQLQHNLVWCDKSPIANPKWRSWYFSCLLRILWMHRPILKVKPIWPFSRIEVKSLFYRGIQIYEKSYFSSSQFFPVAATWPTYHWFSAMLFSHRHEVCAILSPSWLFLIE